MTPWCCKIGCNRAATHRIQWDDGTPESGHLDACARHLEELLPDCRSWVEPLDPSAVDQLAAIAPKPDYGPSLLSTIYPLWKALQQLGGAP